MKAYASMKDIGGPCAPLPPFLNGLPECVCVCCSREIDKPAVWDTSQFPVNKSFLQPLWSKWYSQRRQLNELHLSGCSVHPPGNFHGIISEHTIPHPTKCQPLCQESGRRRHILHWGCHIRHIVLHHKVEHPCDLCVVCVALLIEISLGFHCWFHSFWNGLDVGKAGWSRFRLLFHS